jgi:hypothetical protein|tara:strand:- start:218 stop:349 length:132 start_codon:yes stop_codon:yes gene_type:complete
MPSVKTGGKTKHFSYTPKGKMAATKAAKRAGVKVKNTAKKKRY